MLTLKGLMLKLITIDELWDLVFKPRAFDGTDEVNLYFTEGPENETHGLFGEIEFELAEEE